MERRHGIGMMGRIWGTPRWEDDTMRRRDDQCVEEHRSLVGRIRSRLDNGAFVGLIYSLLVFS